MDSLPPPSIGPAAVVSFPAAPVEDRRAVIAAGGFRGQQSAGLSLSERRWPSKRKGMHELDPARLAKPKAAQEKAGLEFGSTAAREASTAARES